MRGRKRREYNFSNLDTEITNGQQSKIELVSCKGVNSKCTSIIENVNESYRESELFRIDKNFEKAIETLRNAYKLTFAFTEKSCFNCGELLRSTIIETLERIADEIDNSSKGFFKRKDLRLNFEFAENVIKELKAMEAKLDD